MSVRRAARYCLKKKKKKGDDGKNLELVLDQPRSVKDQRSYRRI